MNVSLGRAIADLEKGFDLERGIDEPRDPVRIASVRRSNEVGHGRVPSRSPQGYQVESVKEDSRMCVAVRLLAGPKARPMNSGVVATRFPGEYQ
jgi:hypothetical protein